MQPSYRLWIKYVTTGWKVVTKRQFPKQGLCNHSSAQKLEAKQATLQLADDQKKEFSVVSFLSDPSVQQLLEPYGDERILQENELPEETREDWRSKLDEAGKRLASCKLQGKDRGELRVKLIRKLQETTGIVLDSGAYHNLRNKNVIDIVTWYERTLREQLNHNSIIEDYIRKSFPSNVRLDPMSYRKPEKRYE